MTGLKEKNQKLSRGVQAYKQTQFDDPYSRIWGCSWPFDPKNDKT